MRFQRTHQLLQEVFIALIIEQGYEQVSVKAIVDRADVGNKTFYRHYQDKEDLLYAVLSGILLEAQQILLPANSPDAPEENTITAFRFAHKHAELVRVLLRSPMAERLVQPMIVFGLSEGQRSFGGSTVPDDLVASHFVTTMMSLIRWWLEHDMPYPPDQMAEYANQLLIRPLLNLARREG